MDTQKLQENTEEYFKAHGIVPGQVNELRIGGTVFRFPAGVGLNPYTAEGIPLLANGAEGIPLSKTPGKIVKGQADYVSLFLLDRGQGFFPIEHPRGPFYTGATGSAIEIVIGEGYRESLPSDWRLTSAMKAAVSSQRNLQSFGLEEFIFDGGKNPGSKKLFYVATNVKTPRGGPLVIGCEPKPDGTGGYLDEASDCSVLYQAMGGFSVSYSFSGVSFLPDKWQEIHRAVTHFIDSVAVK